LKKAGISEVRSEMVVASSQQTEMRVSSVQKAETVVQGNFLFRLFRGFRLYQGFGFSRFTSFHGFQGFGFGVIQIIRDTQRLGGGHRNVTNTFFCLLKP
jgi:hypothetical protein